MTKSVRHSSRQDEVGSSPTENFSFRNYRFLRLVDINGSHHKQKKFVGAKSLNSIPN